MCVCALLELSLYIWLRLWSINKTNHHSKCLIEPLVIFSEHCCFVWNGTNKRIIYNSQYSRQPAQLFTPALHSCEALVRMVSRIVYFRSRIFIHTTLLKRKIVWKRKKKCFNFFLFVFMGFGSFSWSTPQTTDAIEWQIHYAFFAIRFVLVDFRLIIGWLGKVSLWLWQRNKSIRPRICKVLSCLYLHRPRQLGLLRLPMDLFKIDWNERYMPITWNKND